MKRLHNLSWTVLVLTLLVMGINAFVPLPDWAVRLDGAAMLLALPLTAFSMVLGRLKH